MKTLKLRDEENRKPEFFNNHCGLFPSCAPSPAPNPADSSNILNKGVRSVDKKKKEKRKLQVYFLRYKSGKPDSLPYTLFSSPGYYRGERFKTKKSMASLKPSIARLTPYTETLP